MLPTICCALLIPTLGVRVVCVLFVHLQSLYKFPGGMILALIDPNFYSFIHWTDIYWALPMYQDFPGGSDIKASAYNAGDRGSISGSGRSPGEENATHSSILAWKIPWTEEPGRLQSMGLQRVGHNWATSLSFLSYIPIADSCWYMAETNTIL